MEKSGERTEITTQDVVNLASSSIRKNVESLVFSSKCCIYKVPEYVRKGKEECYRPRVMSIGPLHYGDPKLETMQQGKYLALEWFLRHPKSGGHSVEYYLDFIKQKEEQIYECYQGIERCKKISSERFVEMILLDAVYIIFLFISSHTEYRFDAYWSLLKIPKDIRVLMPLASRDVFLLENQLPYFILDGLYAKSFGTTSSVQFIELTRNFMGSIPQFALPGSHAIKTEVATNKITDASSIEHLLHFLCYSLSLDFIEEQNVTKDLEQNNLVLPFPAKKLRDAGIKFMASESENQLHIRYKDGVLEIPNIELDTYTETAIRNILYFEQCYYLHPERNCFINYMFFLDALVNTGEDIQILFENKIFHSNIGTYQEAADIFNKVTTETWCYLSNYIYTDICREMNAYADARWHRWKATLKRDYFNSPWSIISVLYAIVLLILTIIQVYTGFKSK